MSIADDDLIMGMDPEEAARQRRRPQHPLSDGMQ